MAFPLPSHLPRAGFSRDGAAFGSTSSHAEPFLKRIGQTQPKDIKLSVVSAWVKDLDAVILETKERIHTRIQNNLSAFEEQIESSRQAQTKLKSLSISVEDLEDALSNPEVGILPNLLQTLRNHSALAQDALDAVIQEQNVSHLVRCRDAYRHLHGLAEQGQLVEVIRQVEDMTKLISEAPEPLKKATVLADLKRKYRALIDRVHEQLGDAYSLSVVLETSPTGVSLRIRDLVPVSNTPSIIHLHDILSSMATETLTSKLTSLRKELVVKLVTPLLENGTSGRGAAVTTEDDRGKTLNIDFGSEQGSGTVSNLRIALDYIRTSLFPSLPPSEATLPLALYQPITDAMLSKYLRPSIPSSLGALSEYLQEVQEAVELEASVATDWKLPANKGRIISEWARDVGAHYEKRRREDVVALVREFIEDPAGDETGVGVRVQDDVPSAHQESESEESSPSSGVVVGVSKTDDEDDGGGWEFDAQDPVESPAPSEPEAVSETSSADPEPDEGWGFDDDMEPPPSASTYDTAPSEAAGSGSEKAPDGDGWGWDDEPPPTPQLPPPNPLSAKPARGLEKFSAHKGTPTSASASSVTSSGILPPANISVPKIAAPPERAKAKKPIPTQKIPEVYLVSPCAKRILLVAEETLAEAKQLATSEILTPGTRGNLLTMTVPSLFDLYRALYPISHADTLTSSFETAITYSSGDAMRFSNDCRYLSLQLPRLISQLGSDNSKPRLEETKSRLKATGEVWFDKTLDVEVDKTATILSRANAFINSADEAQFTETSGAVEDVLASIQDVARTWKNILTKTSYLEATGALVDDTIARIIDDITSLSDIPEDESHRLNELLKILLPVEDLFTDGEHSTVVTHVPNWLKFSYLAELLEASMTDISYLFDEGALIDFSIEELVRLVKALFADTPNRARTIEKISQGHPASE